MFKIYILILLTIPFLANNLYLPKDNIDLEKAEEIQNALCSITTKEIEATANATITRQLKGVCTSNELHLKIDKLQTKILQEIDGIRYILEINGFKVPDASVQSENLVSDYDNFNFSTNMGNRTDPVVPTLVTKSLSASPRKEEILLYNATTLDSEEGNKYFYYWKIENIQELLAKNDMYKSSPAFIVLGHTLHLQFYPNYLDEEHFMVLLKPNSRGFVKKHRLTILNQLEPGSDIMSGILYGIKNEERMLIVSVKNLDVQGFIIKDSLIIKVEILLNS